MARLSDGVTIPIECPQCGHKIEKRLSELQRKHEITCRCGVVFTVDPTGFKSAGKGLDDLQKAIGKLRK